MTVPTLPTQVVIAEYGESSNKKKGSKGPLKFKAREEGSTEPTDVALHPSCVASKGGVLGSRSRGEGLGDVLGPR
jgi:hypothetical protein